MTSDSTGVEDQRGTKRLQPIHSHRDSNSEGPHRVFSLLTSQQKGRMRQLTDPPLQIKARQLFQNERNELTLLKSDNYLWTRPGIAEESEGPGVPSASAGGVGRVGWLPGLAQVTPWTGVGGSSNTKGDPPKSWNLCRLDTDSPGAMESTPPGPGSVHQVVTRTHALLSEVPTGAGKTDRSGNSPAGTHTARALAQGIS